MAANIKELKVLVDILIELGHGDTVIAIDNSRDGIKSHTSATAHIKKAGTTQDPCMVLLVR